MDNEEIENNSYEANLIKNVLHMDVGQFERYKASAARGFIVFGCSFLYHLGHLLLNADIQNSVKIMNVWAKECNEYDMLYRIYLAKEKAKIDE